MKVFRTIYCVLDSDKELPLGVDVLLYDNYDDAKKEAESEKLILKRGVKLEVGMYHGL